MAYWQHEADDCLVAMIAQAQTLIAGVRGEVPATAGTPWLPGMHLVDVGVADAARPFEKARVPGHVGRGARDLQVVAVQFRVGRWKLAEREATGACSIASAIMSTMRRNHGVRPRYSVMAEQAVFRVLAGAGTCSARRARRSSD